jgi:signal transduction histidine kinase
LSIIKPEKHHFLIVDDNEGVLSSLKRLFKKDYHLYLAPNAEEALGILENSPIQLVMADHRMPKTTGLDFLKIVRKKHPQVVRILFTGYTDLDALISAINDGHLYRYIQKPFDPAELKLIISKASEYWSMSQERMQLINSLEKKNRDLETSNYSLKLAYEELKTLDKLKSSFAAVVSHELNTPVSVIAGLSKMLSTAAQESQGTHRAIQSIQQASKRLMTISEKINKALITQDPTTTINISKIAVASLFENLSEYLEPILETRDQELICQIEWPNASINADLFYLNDMLQNLVSNAIKFSPDGSKIILKCQKSTLQGRDALQFSVRDWGIGIRDEDKDWIFNSYFGTFDTQHHSSGLFEFEKRGLGLGLFLVKKLASLHRGVVDFCSTVGEGSEFRITLPVTPELDSELNSVEMTSIQAD